MAGNISDYAEKAMLDWLMGGAAPTRPAAWYVGLTSSTTDDATGGTEISGNGYSRQAVTFAGATAGTGSTANTNAFAFGFTGAAGTITDLVIFDAQTGGNRLWHGPLNATRSPIAGDSLNFAAGALTLTLD